MENPFVYGQEVAGEEFCNRKTEAKELLSDIMSGQNVIIYSPRRYGKTSLIKEVLRKAAKEGTACIYVDLYPVLNESDFVRVYATAITQALSGRIEKTIDNLKNIFKSLRPKIVINSKGEAEIGIETVSADEAHIEDAAESVKRYAEKNNVRVVVVFDEFQQIAEFPTDRMEKQLRGIVQSHGKKVSYFFMGRKKHMIYEMFSNPGRPFYRVGRHFPLEKIRRNELVDFVISRFKCSGTEIPEDMAGLIVDTAECHPYYVQHLASSVWRIKGKNLTSTTVDAAVDLTLQEERNAFQNIWDEMTLNQRKTLRLISRQGASNKIYSKAVLSKYDLSEASLQRTLKSLLEKDIIDKTEGRYEISDIFFKLWICKLG